MNDKLRTYRSMLTWLNRVGQDYRLQAWLNILIGILHVVLGLLSVWLTKQIVDMATADAPLVIGGYGLSLFVVSGLLVMVMLTSEMLVYCSRWIRGLLGVRSRNRLQARLFDRLIQADWQQIRKMHSGQMMSRLTQDVEAVSIFLSEKLPQLVASMVQFVGAFCFLFIMDKRLALVVVIVIPILVVLAQFYMRRMRRYSHEVRDEESRIQSFIQEHLQHTLILKTLERISWSSRLLGTHHEDLQRLIRRNTRYSATAALMVNSSFVAGYLIAFFWGIHSLSTGVITFGAMIAFVQLVGQLQMPIRTMVGYVGIFINTATATERLMEIEDLHAEEIPNAELSAQSDCRLTESIVVDDVCFGYEPDKPVLNHWSARFAPQSVTAIVGHTGSGKTTLISLLLGLAKPQSGSITPMSRHLYSYVPQGNSLMSGTIRDNLRIGNPNATDEQMLEALTMVEADFVLRNAHGLDMSCGERGTGLSEGQAQRVGIARALLRPSPVLLLDEAFSALDSETANRVLDNILSHHERTVIYITHRDALMPKADQIIRI